MLFCAFVFFSVGHVHIHGICVWNIHNIFTCLFVFHFCHNIRTGGILSQFLEHWHQPPRGETNRVERKDISIRAWTT